MNWRFLRAFPKYAIVIGIIVASTALFAAWWYLKHSTPVNGVAKQEAVKKQEPLKVETLQKKAASLPEKLGWLAVVGSDLYNIQTGELVFPNWLRGLPQRVFYHPDSNRLLVQAENGIIRFGLDGKQDAVMGAESPPAFTNDGKHAMWVKGGDIWIGDVDWTAFKFTNERQATKYGQFYAPYFSANVVLASEGACIVRIQNRPLRVNLRTGDLQQMTLPITIPGRMRSPDCEVMIGDDGAKIFVYDVDEAEARYFQRGEKMSDAQWMNNDFCALMLAGKNLSLYDRRKNAVTPLVGLPFPCTGITLPSPDGRYVLAGSKGRIVVVDTKTKRVEELGVEKPQHLAWVSNDTLVLAREAPDMQVRGTWLKTLGNPERLVTMEPYLVGHDGTASVALLESLNFVVFSTREALFRMRPDGAELQEIAKLKRPGGVIQGVRRWGE